MLENQARLIVYDTFRNVMSLCARVWVFARPKSKIIAHIVFPGCQMKTTKVHTQASDDKAMFQSAHTHTHLHVKISQVLCLLKLQCMNIFVAGFLHLNVFFPAVGPFGYFKCRCFLCVDDDYGLFASVVFSFCTIWFYRWSFELRGLALLFEARVRAFFSSLLLEKSTNILTNLIANITVR